MNPFRQSVPRTLLALLAASAAGCAHTSTAAPAAPPSTEPLVVTGSRLPQPVDARTGLPTTPSVVRTYTSEDLSKTGRPEIGSALQQLDPAVRP
jgi:hypothetical protein